MLYNFKIPNGCLVIPGLNGTTIIDNELKEDQLIYLSIFILRVGSRTSNSHPKSELGISRNLVLSIIRNEDYQIKP